MAIKKTIQTDYGFPVTHWKPTSINIDFLNMKAESITLGYANKEAMDAGKVGNHLDMDRVFINFYETQDALDRAKPQKDTNLVVLESLEERDEEQEKLYNELKAAHEANVQKFLLKNILINEEIKEVFLKILKFQYQFHLGGEKLAGGEFINDNTELYDSAELNS